jgi:hypothetical protein
VPRRWPKRIAIAAAVLAVLAVVAVVAARLWVGSERGRRTVERTVDRALAQPLGGHIRIGHIAGTLIGGATLDRVEWRDAAGQPALRARRVVAKWSATGAIAGRPTLELRVESPVVDVERLAAGVDVEEVVRSLARAGEKVDAVTLSTLELTDATVQAGGLTIPGINVRARDVTWNRAAARVAAAALTVHAGASSATLRGSLSRDAIDLRVAALRIAPDDLRRLSPRAEAPRTPIEGDARIRGALDHARIDGALEPDRGRVMLAGTIDLRGRSARLRATLDDLEAYDTPAVVAGTLALTAAATGRTLTVDWRADGHTFRRELDANLQLSTRRARAFATVRPGGRFHGRGQLVARVEDGAPSARMRFSLTVADPGQAARLVAGPDLRATAAPLVVDGDWRLPPRAAPTLTLTRRRP